jgi:predicted nucleotidyltransferase component of viral defense system
MPEKLYYHTVTPMLLSVLKTLMKSKEFDNFRLVGGTALSLYQGHRMSEDIDLFTDAPYKSVDFKAIDDFFRNQYPSVSTNNSAIIGMGKTYYLGENENNYVKVDLYYTDEFFQKAVVIDGIRMASLEEIIAMKIEVISRMGRKKDFWDIHELIDYYTPENMLNLHEQRYPYSHDRALIKANFTNFSEADELYDPTCLRGKIWDVIKFDITKFANGIKL